ncbi:MAG: DUF2802 domain-containing protein [Oligoflexia bacterium]|nr:DUF2802 domain-containing protein [Oligoflexia bacterium]
MGLLILLQVALDLAFIAIVSCLLIERSRTRNAEDPRMSKGLQLLTSKIAILQDLMDRSETIGRQLTQIIDGKQQDVQERVEDIERHLHKVQTAIEKSQEVAKIFQDRIPHQEIIERQTTVKYLQAAKLANQGFSTEDISRQVDIPQGELELIIKLNRDRLVVDKEPVWLNDSQNTPAEEAITTTQQHNPLLDVYQKSIKPEQTQVITQSTQSQSLASSTKMGPPKSPEEALQQATIARAQARARAKMQVEEVNETRGTVFTQEQALGQNEIKPVIFKRISIIDDLG